ncbi:MAG: response regulator [Acidobacteria bacterium]|nr:response regulator [Acidobacteriota bacterium]
MKRVLLADDSVAGRKSIQGVLEAAGIELVTVGNGDLALSKLEEVAPQMVLLDVAMPGRSSYTVCEEIKKDPRYASIPVLLVSSEFEPFDEQAAEAAGADGHLIKPFGTLAVAQIREVWTRTAPPDTAELEGAEGAASPSASPMSFPGPEAFITSAMKASDVEKAVAAKELERSGYETGGRAVPAVARKDAASPVPDHLLDDTVSPERAKRAPTTENLDHESISVAADTAGAAGIGRVSVGDMRSQGDRCPNCTASLNPGDIFCVACGSMVLLTSEEADRAPVAPACGECGAELMAGEIFCVSCGAVAGGVNSAG